MYFTRGPMGEKKKACFEIKIGCNYMKMDWLMGFVKYAAPITANVLAFLSM